MSTGITNTAERDAIRADATRRLPELRNAARRLQRDQDDAQVLSELTVVRGQVRQAEAILTPGGGLRKFGACRDRPGRAIPPKSQKQGDKVTRCPNS